MGGVDFYVCFIIFSSLASFFILYWIVRLAVRHGIADADERRRTRTVLEQYEKDQDH
jgi:hypothetical protein